MTTAVKPSGWSAAYTLTWDAWNRLVKAQDGGSTVAEYQYDAKHGRVVKKVYASGSLDHTEHNYLSEQNQVLEVRKDSGTTAWKQFTWGNRYIDDLVFRTRDTNADGTLDEQLYALQDANWNVTALTNSSGTVVERFRYDPYGNSTVLDANFTLDSDGVSDYGWEYRFTNREHDSETGLSYFRARYWHPTLGRFIGRDPLGYVDGGSLYAGYFVPGRLDPSGLQGSCGDMTDEEAEQAAKDWLNDAFKHYWDENKDDFTDALDDFWPNPYAWGIGGGVVGGIGGAVGVGWPFLPDNIHIGNQDVTVFSGDIGNYGVEVGGGAGGTLHLHNNWNHIFNPTVDVFLRFKGPIPFYRPDGSLNLDFRIECDENGDPVFYPRGVFRY